jgi:hypothetical protein
VFCVNASIAEVETAATCFAKGVLGVIVAIDSVTDAGLPK